MFGRAERIGAGGSVACRAIVARGVVPVNGGLPVSIS